MMITERELQREEKEWSRQKDLLTRQKKIKDEKKEFRHSLLPKIPTTKLLMAFLFLNCTFVEVFTGYITIKSFEIAETCGVTPDLTPIATLISAVISEVLGFAVYAIKSTKENTRGGIVFENAMRSLDSSDETTDEENEAMG